MERNLKWITGLQEAPSPSVIEAERISEEAKEAGAAIAKLARAIILHHEFSADVFEDRIMSGTPNSVSIRNYVAELKYKQELDEMHPTDSGSSSILGEPYVIPPSSRVFRSRGHRGRRLSGSDIAPQP